MNSGLPFALTIGGLSFLLGVIWGGPFVEILRRFRIGKQVRAEIMDKHHEKIGTPTMGGIMIVIPALLLLFAINIPRIVQRGEGISILLPMFVLLGYAILGFLDDWEGIQLSRATLGEGLSARVKFMAQLGLATIFSLIISLVNVNGGFSFANEMFLPLFSIPLSISPFLFIPVSIFIIVGMSNAVNLVDGLDGLAGLVTASSFVGYGVIAFLQGQIFIVQLCFIMVGACFAFL